MPNAVQFAQNQKKSTWERRMLATQIAFQRVKNRSQNSPRGPNPEIHKSDARSIAPRRHSVLFYVCCQNQLKTWYNNLTIVEPLNTNIQRFPRLPRVVTGNGVPGVTRKSRYGNKTRSKNISQPQKTYCSFRLTRDKSKTRFKNFCALLLRT